MSLFKILSKTQSTGQSVGQSVGPYKFGTHIGILLAEEPAVSICINLCKYSEHSGFISFTVDNAPPFRYLLLSSIYPQTPIELKGLGE